MVGARLPLPGAHGQVGDGVVGAAVGEFPRFDLHEGAGLAVADRQQARLSEVGERQGAQRGLRYRFAEPPQAQQQAEPFFSTGSAQGGNHLFPGEGSRRDVAEAVADTGDGVVGVEQGVAEPVSEVRWKRAERFGHPFIIGDIPRNGAAQGRDCRETFPVAGSDAESDGGEEERSEPDAARWARRRSSASARLRSRRGTYQKPNTPRAIPVTQTQIHHRLSSGIRSPWRRRTIKAMVHAAVPTAAGDAVVGSADRRVGLAGGHAHSSG